MKHFLSLTDLSPVEIQHLLDMAIELKNEWKAGGNKGQLAGQTLAMVFQKPSLRTRVSFDMGMIQLGGQALYLSPNEIQLGKRESVADVARVLARYVDGVMARVFSHDHIIELAENSSVPIINGLSDYNHPCQGMADLLTILEKHGRISGLKIAFVGDGNNVARTLMFGAAKLGAHFVIATPEGYAIGPQDVALAKQYADASGGTVSTLNDPIAAVKDAAVIYTDTWASMGQEEEAALRRQLFPPYQVNQALLKGARSDVIVMHCLPAHRGEEITDQVADGPNSVLFDQAENRLHAQKAILVELMG
jgi:ornithine carbamoyltransferase